MNSGETKELLEKDGYEECVRAIPGGGCAFQSDRFIWRYDPFEDQLSEWIEFSGESFLPLSNGMVLLFGHLVDEASVYLADPKTGKRSLLGQETSAVLESIELAGGAACWALDNGEVRFIEFSI